MRKVCIVYWLLLTALLLVRNPLDWLPGRNTATAAYDLFEPWAHFLAFLALAIGVFLARFSLSRWRLAGLLAVYAAATEIVQGFVGRKSQLIDLTQDLAGLAVGAVIAWILRRATRAPISPPEAPQEEAAWQTPRRRT